MSKWMTIKSKIDRSKLSLSNNCDAINSIELLMEELETHLKYGFREQNKAKTAAVLNKCDCNCCDDCTEATNIPGTSQSPVPDYSWLITSPTLSPTSEWKISLSDRKNLEDLMSKVPSSQCAEVIKEFRRRLTLLTDVSLAATQLIAVMQTLLEEFIDRLNESSLNQCSRRANFKNFFRNISPSTNKISNSEKIVESKVNGLICNNYTNDGKLFIRRRGRWPSPLMMMMSNS